VLLKWINITLNRSRRANLLPPQKKKISCFKELGLLSGKLEASPEL
jgi:hypothetical protein